MLNFSRITGKQERAEWGEHPYTRYILLKARTDLKESVLTSLLALCATSTDPKVTAKLAEYRSLEEIIDFFEKSGRETDGT